MDLIYAGHGREAIDGGVLPIGYSRAGIASVGSNAAGEIFDSHPDSLGRHERLPVAPDHDL
jgi:hypothetical protein